MCVRSLIRAITGVLLVLTTSCGPAKAILTGPNVLVDADGDGYTTEQGDCDDFDSSTHPGAPELCDGIDNDCNGQVDDGACGDTGDTDLPIDADGDGYASDIDCNDADPNVHPDAAEVCNGIDDNCDGIIDTDAIDRVTIYADGDRDGYGVDEADTNAMICPDDPLPDGYADAAGDCDDAETNVHPDAAEICNEVDDDCNGAIDDNAVDARTWYADTDGDLYGDPATAVTTCVAPPGYVDTDGDCNDADPDVNPGAAEVCGDGIDNNCNPADDASGSAWYADTDGDGYGDAISPTISCTTPSGYVLDDADCDDTDASVNPGATEVCNGVDDDCNGTIDDGATDAITYYADTDGDGYGDPFSTASACSAPSGYVSDDTDCDDTLGSVHPGATEVCNGVDDNCDLAIDEGVESIFYADTDGDGYGDLAATASACTAPPGYTSDDTDCDDANAAVNPGETEVCNGIDDNCDLAIDEGVESIFYADTDGDGYGDPSSTAFGCSAPSGYVADDNDCDDTDASINPSASELCDGVDNDCNGTIDDSLGTTTYYRDADGDGFGDASSTVVACALPSGYVADATDCDDANASAYPGATEYCDDADDNCNGTVDDGAVDPTTWWRDRDGDGYGVSTTVLVQCDQPAGYADSANGEDCNDLNVHYYPGAPDTVGDGIDEDCDGSDG